ncbi:MAG: NADH:flavin oxidoreductase [Tenericutes bacterium]|jgi:NADPH2 dehydrogenase|nr:NADH:flavin oxidoreductase [Mycoplasmatota bacterium]
MNKVFTSKNINNHEIKNRIILPPMVTFNFSENGYVNDRKIDHYKQIAENGIGMIIVEATAIHPNGRLSDDQLGIWDDKFIPGLKELVDVVHEADCKIVIQIHHAGSKTKVTGLNEIVSASDYKHARALKLDEIKEIINDFKSAGIRAEKAGFDGVEVHGAHGYLLTQFFSEKSNERTDEYGGSFENRIRIAKEIYSVINASTPDNFIIGMRMGCNENSLDESKKFAQTFENLGYDYLSVSTGLDATEIDKPEDFPYHWIVYGGTEIKKVVDIPVIGVYKIKEREQIEYLINNNLLDFVAVGRGQLADYNFTKHLKENGEILYCLECNPCQWRYDGSKCPRQIEVAKKKANR